MRRQALNPFFSKASIVRLQPIITSLVEKLCVRIDECKRCRTANQHPIGIYVFYNRCHNIVFPQSMLESPRYSRLVAAVVQNYPGDSGDEQVVKAVSLDVENHQRTS
jgi:hypothetical protein